MATGFIELNDAGIKLAIDGQPLATVPGYAVLDGKRLMVGEEARKHARLLPRWTNNRFWNQLNTDALSNGTDGIRHHADLAFQQLENITQTLKGIDQCIVAVPGYFERDQLSLLLGMAKECGLPIGGLVDLALINVAREPGFSTVLYLDISLHRISLTVLKSDGMIRKVDYITIAESGLFTLWDRWANIIAGQFIQTSRFDPMHQANSEQALFDTLPGWIRANGGERTRSFDLDVGGSRQSTPISQEQLISACATIYPTIVQTIRNHLPGNEQVSLFVSSQFLGFPGLEASLRLIPDLDIEFINPEAGIQSAHTLKQSLLSSGSAVSHITSLPASGTKTVSTSAANDNPTHLLVGNRAFSLAGGLKIGGFDANSLTLDHGNPAVTAYLRGKEAVVDSSDPRVTVNQQPLNGTATLAAGDVLSIDGHSATAIIVA